MRRRGPLPRGGALSRRNEITTSRLDHLEIPTFSNQLPRPPFNYLRGRKNRLRRIARSPSANLELASGSSCPPISLVYSRGCSRRAEAIEKLAAVNRERAFL